MRIKYKVKATRGWSPSRRAVVREMVEWCSIVYQMNWEIYGKLTIKLMDMPEVFGDAIKSVSYTHLTLPTILLV